MPDDPIGGQKNPEDELKDLFDRIEKEETKRAPTFADAPTNDEIRSGLYTSPIESHLHDDSFGIEERTEQEAEELSPEERRLQELDEELAQARARSGRSMPDPPEWQFQRPKIPGQEKPDSVSYIGLGVGLSVGYTMIGCVVIGWGIGKLIDMRAGGYMGQAIGTLVGAIAGLVGGILTIIRAQKKGQ